VAGVGAPPRGAIRGRDGALALSEVEAPWVKDYDALKGEGPTRWADRWNISNWGILSAFGNGIGGRLIEAAILWAQSRHCRALKIETQNINVPACRLYAKHGFTLASMNRHAYAELPDEIQLIWRKEL
jgi:GNAT superfamily N-acetyltransferase